MVLLLLLIFFFFNDTATTEIYTLSLHDALPISWIGWLLERVEVGPQLIQLVHECHGKLNQRSEEHTSELQSQSNLVCRLLLEKKKQGQYFCIPSHNCEIIPIHPVNPYEVQYQLQ